MPMTAFEKKYRRFKFLVLLFRTTNASSCVMSIIDKTFNLDLSHFVNVYFDEILVHRNALQKIVDTPKKVFKRLKQKKLYGKVPKCIFAVKEVEHLRHLISSNGISVEEGKVDSKTFGIISKSRRDARSLLKFVNYY